MKQIEKDCLSVPNVKYVDLKVLDTPFYRSLDVRPHLIYEEDCEYNDEDFVKYVKEKYEFSYNKYSNFDESTLNIKQVKITDCLEKDHLKVLRKYEKIKGY